MEKFFHCRDLSRRHNPYKRSFIGSPKPLKFLNIFCDFETTGDSQHRITDIGAICVGDDGKELETFSKTIKTCPTLIDEFLKFIKEVIGKSELIASMLGKPATYFALLIAHNGFTFDFRVLVNDIYRNKIRFDLQELESICLADTLAHLQKVID